MVKGAKADWGACCRTVSLGSYTWVLSYWNNTIAIGSEHGDIITLDAITGSQMAILSGHTDQVNHFTSSSDGRSLVSGSRDKTVKLWDMQTGGISKTFYGHTNWVLSVSISADCTRIASGSKDNTIHLWNIQTGECYCVVSQQHSVVHVTFSPTDPQHLIFISCGEIWQWNVNGYTTPPIGNGSFITFSPDHTQFALCDWGVVTVQNSTSRAIVAKLHVADGDTCCCFSPDGRLIAAAAGKIAYVWDITTPDPHLVETFVGHTEVITSLVFTSPSSLISASIDQSVKLWQLGVSSTDPAATDPESTSLTSATIDSISLQAEDGIAISTNVHGVVKIWDISTGLCKSSFQIPFDEDMHFDDVDFGQRNAKLIDGRLIFVWYKGGKIYIWDIGKGVLLQTLDVFYCMDLRISGDGSKIFCLLVNSIQAWSMWTWELVGEVELGVKGIPYLDSLCVDGSRIWVYVLSEDLSAQKGWDFGVSGSSPVPIDPAIGRPHLDFIGGPCLDFIGELQLDSISDASWQSNSPPWIRDTVTGKEVFQLSGRYEKPTDVQWDGQYLVAGYRSGEVLILDFHCIYPH